MVVFNALKDQITENAFIIWQNHQTLQVLSVLKRLATHSSLATQKNIPQVLVKSFFFDVKFFI